jgi:hypothetical protein
MFRYQHQFRARYSSTNEKASNSQLGLRASWENAALAIVPKKQRPRLDGV